MPTATPTRDVRVALVHLGCARNLIDSETILGRLGAEGYALVGDVDEADVAVLNTCSFLGEARDESEGALADLLGLKRSGRLRAVIVTGCLPQKFLPEVSERFPEVDAFLGLSDYSGIARVVEDVLKGRKVVEVAPEGVARPRGEFHRLLQTPRSHAYLRPSHGCDHRCAFCIIPSIRGRQRSKPVAEVVAETEALVAQGVAEVVLVAEDTTGYGTDLGPDGPRLPDLVAAMAQVPGLRRLRVMYAYPNAFPWQLCDVMREHGDVVAPYLDVPIQHVATPVLKAMRRGGTRESVVRLLERLREEVPDITLRTTVLVGHPGEGEAEFEELLTFLGEFRFPRLGAFAFSPEPGAPAAAMAGRCSDEEARERLHRVMVQQADVHASFQRSLVGATDRVLVDGHDGVRAIGRGVHDAPEVDGIVRIEDPARRLVPGALVDVRYVAADGYDLVAEPLDAPA